MPDAITRDVARVTGRDCRTGPGSAMFDMEVHLPRLLVDSPCSSGRGEPHDLVLVPVFANKYACAVAARTNGSYALAAYREAMQLAYEHARRGPLWQRHDGHDHVFVVTHGFAYDALPPELLERAILLLSHGNRFLGFTPERDVIIPPLLTAHAYGAAQRHVRPWQERPLLASFKGVVRPYWQHSFGIRQLWQDLFADSPDVRIEDDRDSDYDSAYAAVFCLCPPGFYAWTPRPIEALFYGCIPVVVGEELVLPFDGLVPWDDIALRLTFDEAVRVDLILRAVPPERRTAMQRAGRAAMPLFRLSADGVLATVLRALAVVAAERYLLAR